MLYRNTRKERYHSAGPKKFRSEFTFTYENLGRRVGFRFLAENSRKQRVHDRDQCDSCKSDEAPFSAEARNSVKESRILVSVDTPVPNVNVVEGLLECVGAKREGNDHEQLESN